MKRNNISRVEENECIGCKACETICPVHAIEMQRNDEGFEYPFIADELCINCGKCIAFCPAVQHNFRNEQVIKKTFAARCQNEDVLIRSSSGGVFGVLAEYCIQQRGVVYGVAFDENYQVIYIRGENYSDIERMRGSKYVDAFMSRNVIEAFLNDISSGIRILFSGTSCQIAGMKAICKERRLKDDNVWWIDFYKCSGKVSALLWEKECKIYKKKGKVEEISFRNKTNGWKNFSMYQYIEGKSYVTDFLTHRWTKFLGSDSCRRKPCLNCVYSRGRSGADISIGDFWYQVALPEKWRDNKGLSVVQVNTDKGQKLFQSIEDSMEYIEVHLPGPVEKKNKKEDDAESRRRFWETFHRQGYDAVCERYAKITWKDKLLFGKIRPLMIKLGLR